MAPAKILITEDEVLIAREIEITLQELGYVVVGIASDGQSALAKVAETQPDLVLMDIVISGEADGIETADRIRDRFRIPIIFLTAYADSDTLQRAKVTAPFGYVLKPFQPQELNIAIQIALVRHRAEQFRLESLRKEISTLLPHEINTPLHSILGFTDVLLNHYDSMSRVEALETLQCIRSSATQLERLCQNFLLHAKLNLLANNPAYVERLLQAETWATQELIQTCSERTAKLCGRIADLRSDLQDRAVQMESIYFEKIVIELLENAFKFSEPRTVVWVRSYIKQQKFHLSVADRGRGMTPEQINRIGAYTQFTRDTFVQSGLGLGLALVQQLVTLHQGNITIASAIDDGTTVTIQLPMPATDL